MEIKKGKRDKRVQRTGVPIYDVNGLKYDKEATPDARRFLIIADLAKGMKYTDMCKKYMDAWGLGLNSVEMYIHEAINFMRSDTAKENIISANMERLDKIISDSLQKNDRKSAIRAIDTQNKLAGGYINKVELDSGSEINLKFDIGE